MLRFTFILTCLFLTHTANLAAPALKDRKDDDQLRIVGKWRQEALCMRGGEMKMDTSGTFRFGSDGTCGITTNGNSENPALFTLDTSTTPRRMKWLNGPERTEWSCLYEIDGDKLKVAFVDHNTEAPKKIDSAPNLTIYYLKRIKD